MTKKFKIALLQLARATDDRSREFFKTMLVQHWNSCEDPYHQVSLHIRSEAPHDRVGELLQDERRAEVPDASGDVGNRVREEGEERASPMTRKFKIALLQLARATDERSKEFFKAMLAKHWKPYVGPVTVPVWTDWWATDRTKVSR